MDGGIHALKGFVYQATVILDVLLPHFEGRAGARARPEGVDDLELAWVEGSKPRAEYVQIKKPREDDKGAPKCEPWTLREVAQALLPGTMKHLRGNDHAHRWILGDDIDAEAWALVVAGRNAPTAAPRAYLHTIHLLAREASGVTEALGKKGRQTIGQWRFDPDTCTAPDDALTTMVAAFGARVSALGAKPEKIRLYEDIAREHHSDLPEMLSRLRVEHTYGRDDEVRGRVCDRFASAYPISRKRIVDTLFGNMRTFVDDVAVSRGKWIDRDALDALVARVWPEMIPVREPPPLPNPHIERRRLVERIVGAMPCRAVEIVGVAGSGKTSLARAVYDYVRSAVPDVDAVYCEVRRERTLGEVLTGVAFHLQKSGASAPRDAALRSGITEEERVREVARALDEVPGKTLVLVDLVDGDCNDEFARLLSIFLQAPPPERCTLAVFGQESSLRGLTPLEQELAGIPSRIEQMGFDFEEFVSLAGHFHVDADRQRLWNVYQRAAAGRVAGLFARLAYDLARAPSVEAMEKIVAGPPDQVVPRAVRQRFDRLAPLLRPVADKLACVLLPFRPAEAVGVFPGDPVKATIERLLELGLLQHHDAERLEMHEAVRRAVEDDIPPLLRHEAHAALAAWYAGEGKLLAEIHHLDRAGRHADANGKAREAFLAGQHEHALMDYVASHRLVTGAELAASLLQGSLPQSGYMIPPLLRRLGDTGTADILMAGLRSQVGRFDTDYRWAWWLIESILACDPGRLSELAAFGLEPLRDGRMLTQRLEHITQGARRAKVEIDARLLALFEAQDDAVKWVMLELMVLDPRVRVLEKVLSFLNSHDRPQEGNSYVVRRGPPIALPLRSREQVIAFLEAIPLAEMSRMFVASAHQLGRMAELVWAARAQVQPVCIDLLQSGHENDAVLENALRSLLLLGDERAIQEGQRYRERKSRLGTLVTLLPVLFSKKVEQGAHEARLLDPTRDINDRMGDFAVVSALTDDPGALLQALEIADPVHASLWRFLVLTKSLLRPFDAAIPLLEEELKGADQGRMQILAPLLLKLAELPGRAATDMLLRALSHAAPLARMFACRGLQVRRTRRALVPLTTLLEREEEPQIVQNAVVALVASGPLEMDFTAPFWSCSAGSDIWRFVLAGRLRAESAAPMLVAAATDPTCDWQLRRAAILAATRLPFDLAFARIVDPVMRERSPFTIDQNHALLGHEALCAVLDMARAEEHAGLFQRQGAGIWEVVLDNYLQNAMFREGAPDGKSTIQWSAARLSSNGPPTAEDVRRLINELHVPILHAAVLRGLRQAGRHERIEELARTADTEWLLLRACCEYARTRAGAKDVGDRLQSLIASSRFPDSPFARNVANDSRRQTNEPTAIPQDAPSPAPMTLRAPDVVSALGSGQAPTKPFVVACQDELELRHLADLLDPANDYATESVPAEPSLSFGSGGVMVGGIRAQQRDNRAQLRAALRPAVAVANRFAVPIGWHDRLLKQPQYLAGFLEGLGTAGDADRFYEALAEHADIIVPQFDDSIRIAPIRRLVDARVVPYLAAYASVGTDGLLETLCALAQQVDDPQIDPVLAALFHRWHRRFELTSMRLQHDGNIPLWRAFNSLRTHPRFPKIADYDSRLVELLNVPMQWFNKNDIVRVLLDAPRAYARLESMLLGSASYQHWAEDEVDRLDKASDALFPRVEAADHP